MLRKIVTSVLASALFSLPVWAQAEEEPKPEPKKSAEGRKGKKKNPLGLPDVRALTELLGLSEDQAKDIQSIIDATREEFAELAAKIKEEGGDKKAGRDRFKEIRVGALADVKKALSEEQIAKLDDHSKRSRKKDGKRRKTGGEPGTGDPKPEDK